uniref:Mitochondrial inner membrane protein OXA1 n=1 Tax=Syphacia muris TaxID=451379 RepID=A0A158R5C4_9BILA
NIDFVPPVPTPPAVQPSVEDLVSAGKSVLKELDLFSWWKPTSYLRWAIESIHLDFDLSYSSTILCLTAILRIALIYVPILTQRNLAKQSMYSKELKEFQQRSVEARKEGNALLVQQVLLEQFDFMKRKGIRYGQHTLVLFANGLVFSTWYFALRGMLRKNFPGFSTGGSLWFEDLTVPDPYYILPMLSAATLFTTMKLGIETGATPVQLPPAARLLMQVGVPVFAFFFAIGLYWCVSNFFSLFYYGLFRVPSVRKFLNIPPMAPNTSSVGAAVHDWRNRPKNTLTFADLRRSDARQFQKAGRGKPIIQ